jgi:predicted transcriptional regulator
LNLNVSKYEKVRMITQRNFPIAWFSSKEIQTAFEQEFKEPIGLSTVATYLSRLASKGVLTRSGNSNSLKYKMARVQVEARLEEVKIR